MGHSVFQMANILKLKHRGRAYSCLRCPADMPFTAEKVRVEAHLWKHHVSLDQAPFFCSLCTFRATSERDLTKHVETFKPHTAARQEAIRKGEFRGDKFYLRPSTQPYILREDTDYRKLSPEESQMVWACRPASTRTVIVSSPSCQTNPLVTTTLPLVPPPSVPAPVLPLHHPQYSTTSTATQPESLESLLADFPLPSVPPSSENSTPLASPVRRIIQQQRELEEAEDLLPQLLGGEVCASTPVWEKQEGSAPTAISEPMDVSDAISVKSVVSSSRSSVSACVSSVSSSASSVSSCSSSCSCSESVQKMMGVIEELVKVVTSVQTSVAKVEGEVSKMGQRVTTLSSDISFLRGQIRQVERNQQKLTPTPTTALTLSTRRRTRTPMKNRPKQKQRPTPKLKSIVTAKSN